MRILVTGANGFIGKNLVAFLKLCKDYTVEGFDLEDKPESMIAKVQSADAIVHLAGINRPLDPGEFQAGNFRLTETVVGLLQNKGLKTPLILSSSTQAVLDNPYGRSKKAAEDCVFAYSRRCGVPVFVYRLPNVFGKWGRPEYNSVVATFCHHVARSIPIQIHNPADRIKLVHIDDVMDEFIRALAGTPTRDGDFCRVPNCHEITVGDLAERIRSFRNSRLDLSICSQQDRLTRALYSTYISSLPDDKFAYELKMNVDARGSFTEFIRTPDRGQISINVIKPGVTKGNHWHCTKTEKFLVVSGRGVIRFRRIGRLEIVSYEVSGEKLQVVDIPPGYTHCIRNAGEEEMVTVMWASEPYDPERPDTIFEEVGE